MRLGQMICFLAAMCLPLAAGAEETASARPDSSTAPTEKRAWIGVAVSPATPSLRHQLKTPDGIGLVIEFVQPKSPADEAGLKPFDLLEKLDDQWLVNPEQFAVLVKMHHAGDEVKLTFLREGKEQSTSAKLIEHEVPKTLDLDVKVPWLTPADGQRLIANPESPSAHPGSPAEGNRRVITWIDGRHQATITTADDQTTLCVKDVHSGQTLFDGPIDTDQEKKNLPAEVRGVFESVDKMLSKFQGRGTNASPR
jgi:hypothetical protein